MNSTVWFAVGSAADLALGIYFSSWMRKRMFILWILSLVGLALAAILL